MAADTPFADWPLDDLHLSRRARNCLVRNRVLTIGDLADCSERDLLDIRNFGLGSLAEVRRFLAEAGAGLSGEPEPTL